MAFRSANPPRGPRGGGRGSGPFSNAAPLRIDASGRVDQGFGPVGGIAATADADLDIFGIDDLSAPLQFQQQQQHSVPTQPILYVSQPSLLKIWFVRFRSLEYYALLHHSCSL
jgi:hypothetical protein